MATPPARAPTWLLPSWLPCTREGSQTWGNAQAGPGTLRGHLWAVVLTRIGPSWEGGQRHWPRSQSVPCGGWAFQCLSQWHLDSPIPPGSKGGTGLPRRGVGRGGSDHREVGPRGSQGRPYLFPLCPQEESSWQLGDTRRCRGQKGFRDPAEVSSGHNPPCSRCNVASPTPL